MLRGLSVTLVLPAALCAVTPPPLLSFGDVQKVGSGRFHAWTLTTLFNPLSKQNEVFVSLDSGLGIHRSVDGKTWTPTGLDENLDVSTPQISAGSIHNFGNVQARYQRQKEPFQTFTGDSPVYFGINATGAFSAKIEPSTNLTFTGLPRPMACIQTTCCNCPFRLDSGNAVRLPDKSLILAMNVFLQPDSPIKGDGSSVVLFASDAHGLDWSFRSYIALAEDYQESGEGPNENTITLLADGKTLLCIVRMDAGDGGVGGKPYSKTFSTDGGRSWSPLKSMPAGVGTANPHVILAGPHGPLLLVGGRPGNKLWLNPDGMAGDDWVEYEIPRPSLPASNAGHGTTSYNGVAALTETTGVVTFDYDNIVYSVPYALNLTAIV